MKIPLEKKSSLEEIRSRFDQDVERFSNLESGQQATIDAPLVLQLVSATIPGFLKSGDTILDVGCGAGNFTLSVLKQVPQLHCHLVDLSQPMLQRAEQRVQEAGALSVSSRQTDLLNLELPESSVHCILAGAVLHHLRTDEDWQTMFARFSRWLKPEGRLYVSDLMTFDQAKIQQIMWDRYGDYLKGLGGEEYREKVFAYIDQEDTPRSLPFQLELLKKSGFSSYDVLHRNSVFSCYVGIKS